MKRYPFSFIWGIFSWLLLICGVIYVYFFLPVWGEVATPFLQLKLIGTLITFVIMNTELLPRLLLWTSSVITGWPRIWDLLGYCLPKKTRTTVYDPITQELLEDYLTTRQKYRSKPARCWLNFCFLLRTVLLMIDCWRVLLADKTIQMLAKIVPAMIKQWWTMIR